MVDTEQQNVDTTTAEKNDYLLHGLSSTAEFERLDTQSRAIWQLMGGTHTNAPVPPTASLILDVGCGTGIVSISLGLKNPGAEVIGIDLSAVPPVHTAPPNVMYLEGNIFDLAGKDPRLQPNTADLVHSRFLVLGLKDMDWPKYIQTLVDLTKPGGYVEITEFDTAPYQCHDYNNIVGTRFKVPEGWLDLIRTRLLETGMDPNAGKHVEEHMKSAGLVDVKVKIFPWAYGHWVGKYMPEAAAVGEIDQSSAIKAMILNTMDLSKEKIEQLQREWERFTTGENEGLFSLVYNVVGRKPA